MKYTGRCFEYEETAYIITGAVVSSRRIVVDWLEGGGKGNLIAESDDGVVFRGGFGFPGPESHKYVEFRLYRSGDNEVLLWGRWWRTDTPDGGTWIIRLTPSSAV
jgi:hypothetical protein